MNVKEAFGAMNEYAKVKGEYEKPWLNTPFYSDVLAGMGLNLDELLEATSSMSVQFEAARRQHQVSTLQAFDSALRQAFVAGIIWNRNNKEDHGNEGAPSTGA